MKKKRCWQIKEALEQNRLVGISLDGRKRIRVILFFVQGYRCFICRHISSLVTQINNNAVAISKSLTMDLPLLRKRSWLISSHYLPGGIEKKQEKPQESRRPEHNSNRSSSGQKLEVIRNRISGKSYSSLQTVHVQDCVQPCALCYPDIIVLIGLIVRCRL